MSGYFIPRPDGAQLLFEWLAMRICRRGIRKKVKALGDAAVASVVMGRRSHCSCLFWSSLSEEVDDIHEYGLGLSVAGVGLRANVCAVQRKRFAKPNLNNPLVSMATLKSYELLHGRYCSSLSDAYNL